MERKERTIFITIIANMILIALRFFLAGLSGSLGLEANAWHSFTDVFVSVVVFTGLLVTRFGSERWKKPFAKAENVLAVFVSLFIFYMGIEILTETLYGEKTELRYIPFTAAGAFVGVVINYFMARFKIYIGEQTGSESLKADGYHSKMDMYCSIAVLVGILGSLFGMPGLDKMAAIVAMVLLMISGYEIFTDNLHRLLHPEAVAEAHHHSHGHGNKKVYAVLGGVIAGAYLLSGVYIVNLDEVGILRRFGAVIKDDVAPGIHYRLPSPVDQVTLVKKDAIQSVETGRQELLSGDTNLVNVNVTVQYRVADIRKYALNVTDTTNLVRASAATSIREVIGKSPVDSILTEGKQQIEQESRDLIQDTLDKNDTGIEVTGIQLVEAAPPDAVKDSFQDLASARQDKAVYINEAVAYQNTIIPEANAESYKQIAEAESYKEEKIKTAEGDAALFSEKQAAYAASKDVTEFRMYMETMDKILPNVQKLLLGAGVNVDNAELWISGANNNQTEGTQQ